MLCSNCRIIEICVEAEAPRACENGHYFCPKCMLQATNRCLLCEGSMFDADGNAWIRLQSDELHRWTPEMIREWSNQTELPENLSTESVNDDVGALSEDCDAASMNLLYSRGDAYETESPQNSKSVNMTDSRWNQALIWNDLYPKVQEQLLRESRQRAKPMPNSALGQDKPVLVRKDTRQNLVDQTIEEIREKIMKEIFNSFKNDPRSHIKPEKYAYVKNFHTIGVSTESTPRLLPDDCPKPNEQTAGETKIEPNSLNTQPQEITVMNVDTSDIQTPQIFDELKKKKSASCIDLKFEQVMGTILESAAEKPSVGPEDHHFYKFLREKFSQIPLTKLGEIISSIYNEADLSNQTQVDPTHQNELKTKPSPDCSFMSNSRRALYNPPLTMNLEDTPRPQFQLLGVCDMKVSSDLQQTEVIDAETLNIPRSPVICPISTCQRAFFVSDFTKHIAVDHSKIPIERILPRQCKNFFLDPKLIHYGVSRCQVLLLVKDKIRNLGHEKFKDFIPVLVMTTKVSLVELCSSKYRPQCEEVQNSSQNFIMIWLTGIMPPQLPIFYSLTVWARSGYMPICHIVHSGQLYSVRNSQSPEEVRKSGQMLLLSENQVDLLTNRGRHMLELQIAVH